jgi:hypothetical protein
MSMHTGAPASSRAKMVGMSDCARCGLVIGDSDAAHEAHEDFHRTLADLVQRNAMPPDEEGGSIADGLSPHARRVLGL